MSLTHSEMLPLGTIAPAFSLLDTVSNQYLSLDELKSSIATVIIFSCNHCPYVQHIQNKLVQVANHYQSQGIQFIAISANDAQKYPDDAPDQLKAAALNQHFPFPYLYDETQAVAQAYHAACTPDFYIFDKDLACVYRGRFDGSTPGNSVPVTGKDLCAALEAILQGNPVDPEQKPSVGCNIKWK